MFFDKYSFIFDLYCKIIVYIFRYNSNVYDALS